MKLIGLDLETRSLDPAHPEYALQPWRFQEGLAEAYCCSVARADGGAHLIESQHQYRALLRKLQGKQVVTWNGVFDLAWLISMGLYDEVNRIRWVDGMILWKWLDNSQKTDRYPDWSLAAAVMHFFNTESWAQTFYDMKMAEEAGRDDAYWRQRAKLDSVMTCRVAEEVWDRLDDKRRKSAMITMSGLVPVARSWVIGVPMDYDMIEDITPAITEEMAEIEYRLGVSNFQHETVMRLGVNGWTPSKILRSPKQLAELLYKSWGLKPINYSEKTKEPSTDKASLTYLADDNDSVLSILRWRELNTQLSKYLQSPLKARKYLGKDTVHPSPKIFSTYTGRMTYTSKTSRKYPTGVALHQWPREKKLRALVTPMPGYKHVEYDAAGQESRIMAEQSGDMNMVNVFMEGADIHSMTGSRLAGMSYEDFMDAKQQGNSAVVGSHGFRYQGKFTNLSNNFRIGVKKLRIQARVQYGMDVDFYTAKGWQDAFFDLYPGIREYWGDAINMGKTYGRAETLAGRQFALTYWDKENQWKTESSAIMHPIQGTGADMKDLAIQEIHKHYPEFIFWFDLHDGLHYQVPEDVPMERLLECRQMLDDLDYEQWWGYKNSVPFTWDVSVGPRWSELEEQ